MNESDVTTSSVGASPTMSLPSYTPSLTSTPMSTIPVSQSLPSVSSGQGLTTPYGLYAPNGAGTADFGSLYHYATTHGVKIPTAFKQGQINFATPEEPGDAELYKYFAPRDLMTLDSDETGAATVLYGEHKGIATSPTSVQALNVFGRLIPRHRLLGTKEGRELIKIAEDRRRGYRRGFWDAVKDASESDLPFVGVFAEVAGSWRKAAAVSETFKKLQDFQPVTEEEALPACLYLQEQQEKNRGTFWSSVGEIAVAAPGFMVEMAASGFILGGARMAAVKTLNKVGAKELAAKLATSSNVRTLTRELLDKEIASTVAKTGASLTDDLVKKTVTKASSTITDNVVTFMKANPGAQELYRGFSDDMLRNIAENRVATEQARAIARRCGSSMHKWWETVAQWSTDSFSRALLDYGHWGSTSSTVLFSNHTSAGRAWADTLAALTIEPMVRGAMTMGVGQTIPRLLAKPLTGATDGTVTDSRLSYEASALLEGNRKMMENAKWLAMGTDLLEYMSENAGRALGPFTRGIGLKLAEKGIAKRLVSPTRQLDVATGLFDPEDGVAVGSAMRRIVASWFGSPEDYSKRVQESGEIASIIARRLGVNEADDVAMASVRQALKVHSAANLPPQLKETIGGDFTKFVKDTVHDAYKQGFKSETFKAYRNFVAADWMTRHNLTPTELYDLFEQAGYDGILGEMFEERYNGVAQALLGLSTDPNNQWGSGQYSLAAAWEEVKKAANPGMEQLAIEAVGFALPGVFRAIAMRAQRSLGGGGKLSEVNRVLENIADATRHTAISMPLGRYLVEQERLNEQYDTDIERLTKQSNLARQGGDIAGSELIDRDIKKLQAIQADRKQRNKRYTSSLTPKQQEAVAAAEADPSVLSSYRASSTGQTPNASAMVSETAKDIYNQLIAIGVETDVTLGEDFSRKITPTLTNNQAHTAVTAQESLVGYAPELARHLYESHALLEGEKPSWFRWAAHKIIGLASLITTGDMASISSDPIRWTVQDHGIPTDVMGALRQGFRRTFEEIRDANLIPETGAKLTRKEIFDRAEQTFAPEAQRIMKSYLSTHQLISISDQQLRDLAIAHYAATTPDTDDRKYLYSVANGTTQFYKLKSDGQGIDEETVLSAEALYRKHKDEIDTIQNDITYAVVDLMTRGINHSHTARSRVINALSMDAKSDLRDAAIYDAAMHLIGKPEIINRIRVDGVTPIEDVIRAESIAKVDEDVVSYIASCSDINKVDPRAFETMAHALRKSFDGSEAGLLERNKELYSLARLAGDLSSNSGLVFSKRVEDLDSDEARATSSCVYSFKSARIASGNYYVNAGKDGTIGATTEEELITKMKNLGYEPTRGAIVMGMAKFIETTNMLHALRSVNAGEEFVQKMNRLTEDFWALKAKRSKTAQERAVADSMDVAKNVHPMFRKDLKGNYLFTEEEAESQVTKELIQAAAGLAAGKSSDKYRDYENVWGKNGYMTIGEEILRNHAVSVNKLDIVTGVNQSYVNRSYTIAPGTVSYGNNRDIYVPVDPVIHPDLKSAVVDAIVLRSYANNTDLLRQHLSGPISEFISQLREVVQSHIDRIETEARNKEKSPDAELLSQLIAFKEVVLRPINEVVTNENGQTEVIQGVGLTPETYTRLVTAFCLHRDKYDKRNSYYRAIGVIGDEARNLPAFPGFVNIADLALGGSGLFASSTLEPSDSDDLRGIARLHWLISSDLRDQVASMKNSIMGIMGPIEYVRRCADAMRRAISNLKDSSDPAAAERFKEASEIIEQDQKRLEEDAGSVMTGLQNISQQLNELRDEATPGGAGFVSGVDTINRIDAEHDISTPRPDSSAPAIEPDNLPPTAGQVDLGKQVAKVRNQFDRTADGVVRLMTKVQQVLTNRKKRAKAGEPIQGMDISVAAIIDEAIDEWYKDKPAVSGPQAQTLVGLRRSIKDLASKLDRKQASRGSHVNIQPKKSFKDLNNEASATGNPTGTPTAGTPTAGTPTAGTPSAGTPSAGTPPAGTPPAGTPPATDTSATETRANQGGGDVPDEVKAARREVDERAKQENKKAQDRRNASQAELANMVVNGVLPGEEPGEDSDNLTDGVSLAAVTEDIENVPQVVPDYGFNAPEEASRFSASQTRLLAGLVAHLSVACPLESVRSGVADGTISDKALTNVIRILFRDSLSNEEISGILAAFNDLNYKRIRAGKSWAETLDVRSFEADEPATENMDEADTESAKFDAITLNEYQSGFITDFLAIAERLMPEVGKNSLQGVTRLLRDEARELAARSGPADRELCDFVNYVLNPYLDPGVKYANDASALLIDRMANLDNDQLHKYIEKLLTEDKSIKVNEQPKSRRLAFLLSYLSMLKPNTRIDFALQLGSSVAMTAFHVTSDGLMTKMGSRTASSVSTHQVVSAFPRLGERPKDAREKTAEMFENAIKDALDKTSKNGTPKFKKAPEINKKASETKRAEERKAVMDVIVHNAKIIADAHAKVFGRETPIYTALTSSLTFSGLANNSDEQLSTIAQYLSPQVIQKKAAFGNQPQEMTTIVNLAACIQEVLDRAAKVKGDKVPPEVMHQIAMTALATGSQNNVGVRQETRLPKVTSALTAMFNAFASEIPRTIATAEVDATRDKTGSSVILAPPNVSPMVRRWVSSNSQAAYESNSDGNAKIPSFVALCNQFYGSLYPNGVVPNEVLAECRQNMTWPDLARTPICAKNLSKSLNSVEVYHACAKSYEHGKEPTYLVPLFAGDHNNKTFINVPKAIKLAEDGTPNEKATYKQTCTAIYRSIGMSFLGKETKRSTLSSGEFRNFSLYGAHTAPDGSVQRGSVRVFIHHSFGFNNKDYSFKGEGDFKAKPNEAFHGSTFMAGYGAKVAQLVSKDPESPLLKLHITSTEGRDLFFIKSLVTAESNTSGEYLEGTAQKAIFEFLNSHIPDDLSTGIFTDADSYKIGAASTKQFTVQIRLTPEAAAIAKKLGLIGSSAEEPVMSGSLLTLLPDLARIKVISSRNEANLKDDITEDELKNVFGDESKSVSVLDDLVASVHVQDKVRASIDGTSLSDVVNQILPECELAVIEHIGMPSIALSYLENGASGSHVANVSHGASMPERPEASPRNHIPDALALSKTLADYGALSLKSDQASSYSEVDEALFQQLTGLISSWGQFVLGVYKDESVLEAIYQMSEDIANYRDGGVHRGSQIVRQELARQLWSKIRSEIGIPMAGQDLALQSNGACIDDNGKLFMFTESQMHRDMMRGAEVYDEDEAKFYNTRFRFALANVNRTDPGFRYGWFLDQDAFKAEFATSVLNLSSGARTAWDEMIHRYCQAHNVDKSELTEGQQYAVVIGGVFTRLRELYNKARNALDPADQKELENQALGYKNKIAKCFKNHHGQYISSLGPDYVSDFWFADLFRLGAEPNSGEFDYSAVYCEKEDMVHDEKGKKQIFLAGTLMGFPRTPSGNGSMWAQVVRAGLPITEVKTEVRLSNGATKEIYQPSKHGVFCSDPYTNAILGCDFDGDKVRSYLLCQDGTGLIDTDAPIFNRQGRDPAEVDDAYIQKVAFEKIKVGGQDKFRYVTPSVQDPVTGKIREATPEDVANGSLLFPAISTRTRKAASNVFVQSLYELAYRLPTDEISESTNAEEDPFVVVPRMKRANKGSPRQHFLSPRGVASRPTTPFPVSTDNSVTEVRDEMADPTLTNERGLEDVEAGAITEASARDAGQARGIAVSTARHFHMAWLSGLGNLMTYTYSGRSATKSDAKLAAAKWLSGIYHFDGISNATFDDIKEMLCSRLGWTPETFDTLISRLLDRKFHGLVTTEKDWTDRLVEFTSEIIFKNPAKDSEGKVLPSRFQSESKPLYWGSVAARKWNYDDNNGFNFKDVASLLGVSKPTRDGLSKQKINVLVNSFTLTQSSADGPAQTASAPNELTSDCICEEIVKEINTRLEKLKSSGKEAIIDNSELRELISQYILRQAVADALKNTVESDLFTQSESTSSKDQSLINYVTSLVQQGRGKNFFVGMLAGTTQEVVNLLANGQPLTSATNPVIYDGVYSMANWVSRTFQWKQAKDYSASINYLIADPCDVNAESLRQRLESTEWKIGDTRFSSTIRAMQKTTKQALDLPHDLKTYTRLASSAKSDQTRLAAAATAIKGMEFEYFVGRTTDLGTASVLSALQSPTLPASKRLAAETNAQQLPYVIGGWSVFPALYNRIQKKRKQKEREQEEGKQEERKQEKRENSSSTDAITATTFRNLAYTYATNLINNTADAVKDQFEGIPILSNSSLDERLEGSNSTADLKTKFIHAYHQVNKMLGFRLAVESWFNVFYQLATTSDYYTKSGGSNPGCLAVSSVRAPSDTAFRGKRIESRENGKITNYDQYGPLGAELSRIMPLLRPSGDGLTDVQDSFESIINGEAFGPKERRVVIPSTSHNEVNQAGARSFNLNPLNIAGYLYELLGTKEIGSILSKEDVKSFEEGLFGMFDPSKTSPKVHLEHHELAVKFVSALYRAVITEEKQSAFTGEWASEQLESVDSFVPETDSTVSLVGSFNSDESRVNDQLDGQAGVPTVEATAGEFDKFDDLFENPTPESTISLAGSFNSDESRVNDQVGTSGFDQFDDYFGTPAAKASMSSDSSGFGALEAMQSGKSGKSNKMDKSRRDRIKFAYFAMSALYQTDDKNRVTSVSNVTPQQLFGLFLPMHAVATTRTLGGQSKTLDSIIDVLPREYLAELTAYEARLHQQAPNEMGLLYGTYHGLWEINRDMNKKGLESATELLQQIANKKQENLKFLQTDSSENELANLPEKELKGVLSSLREDWDDRYSNVTGVKPNNPDYRSTVDIFDHALSSVISPTERQIGNTDNVVLPYFDREVAPAESINPQLRNTAFVTSSLLGSWAKVKYSGGNSFTITGKLRGDAGKGKQVSIVVTTGIDSSVFSGTEENIEKLANSYNYAASICAALNAEYEVNGEKRTMSVTDFMGFDLETRKAFVRKYSIGGMALNEPVWSATGKGIATIAGVIALPKGSEGSSTIFHEYFHTMWTIFDQLQLFSTADIKHLQKAFGTDPRDPKKIDVEKAAEAFRKWVLAQQAKETDPKETTPTGVWDVFRKIRSFAQELWKLLTAPFRSYKNNHEQLFNMMVHGIAHHTEDYYNAVKTNIVLKERMTARKRKHLNNLIAKQEAVIREASSDSSAEAASQLEDLKAQLEKLEESANAEEMTDEETISVIHERFANAGAKSVHSNTRSLEKLGEEATAYTKNAILTPYSIPEHTAAELETRWKEASDSIKNEYNDTVQSIKNTLNQVGSKMSDFKDDLAKALAIRAGINAGITIIPEKSSDSLSLSVENPVMFKGFANGVFSQFENQADNIKSATDMHDQQDIPDAANDMQLIARLVNANLKSGLQAPTKQMTKALQFIPGTSRSVGSNSASEQALRATIVAQGIRDAIQLYHPDRKFSEKQIRSSWAYTVALAMSGAYDNIFNGSSEDTTGRRNGATVPTGKTRSEARSHASAYSVAAWALSGDTAAPSMVIQRALDVVNKAEKALREDNRLGRFEKAEISLHRDVLESIVRIGLAPEELYKSKANFSVLELMDNAIGRLKAGTKTPSGPEAEIVPIDAEFVSGNRYAEDHYSSFSQCYKYPEIQESLKASLSAVFQFAAMTKYFGSSEIVPANANDIELFAIMQNHRGAKAVPNWTSTAESAHDSNIGAETLLTVDQLYPLNTQSYFIGSNVDAWISALLPKKFGSADIGRMLSESNTEYAAIKSKAQQTQCFFDRLFGLDVEAGGKILKLEKHTSRFGWDDAGIVYHRDGKGNYYKFNGYKGINGVRAPVSLTEDDLREIDYYYKMLFVHMKGQTEMVTSVNEIRFNRFMETDKAYYSREAIEKRFKDHEQLDGLSMALYRMDYLIPKSILDGPVGDYRAKFLDAAVKALDWVKEHLSDNITEEQVTSYVVSELSSQGFLSGRQGSSTHTKLIYYKDGMKSFSVPAAYEAVVTVPCDLINTCFESSTTYKKLTDPDKGNRPKELLKRDYVAKAFMDVYRDCVDFVNKHPWLTHGDGKYLHNLGTSIPFFEGSGVFMYGVNRVERDAQADATVAVDKNIEALEKLLSSNPSLAELRIADIKDQKVLDSIHGLISTLQGKFNTRDRDIALINAIRRGEYSRGSEKSKRTGLVLESDAKIVDIAYTILKRCRQDLLYAQTYGEAPSKQREYRIDDKAIIASLRQALATRGELFGGAVGLTDDAAYQVFGALPANFQIGHGITKIVDGLTNAMMHRATLANFLMTPSIDGAPVYYADPSDIAVNTSGLPDMFWAQLADWWAKFNNLESLVLPERSGIENAKAIFAVLMEQAGKNGGRLLIEEAGDTHPAVTAKYTLVAGDDWDIASVTRWLVRGADDIDSDDETLLSKAVGSAAEGYLKHFLRASRTLGMGGASQRNWYDHAIAWSKTMCVSFSGFFSFATKWESSIGAVGLPATLASNKKWFHDLIRKNPEIPKILSKLTFGKWWVTSDFLGWTDIIDMMDSNDPFLADLYALANALGVNCSVNLVNPIEDTTTYTDRDIATLTNNVKRYFGAREAAQVRRTMNALAKRGGEKAFTYALNGTKLAVIAQLALKMRLEANAAGKAFDPLRDLRPYSGYINSEVGGIDPMRYAWATPSFIKWANRLMFAWQWTVGAWEAGSGKILEDALLGGHTATRQEREFMVGRWLRMTGYVMWGLPQLTQILCLAAAHLLDGIIDAFDGDGDDLLTDEEFLRKYGRPRSSAENRRHHRSKARLTAEDFYARYGRERNITELTALYNYKNERTNDVWWLHQNESKAKWDADLTPLLRAIANFDDALLNGAVRQYKEHGVGGSIVVGAAGLALQNILSGGKLPSTMIKAATGAVIGGHAPALIPLYTGNDLTNTTGNRRIYARAGKQGHEVIRYWVDFKGQMLSKLAMPIQRALEGIFGYSLSYVDKTFEWEGKGQFERWFDPDPRANASINMLAAYLPFSMMGLHRNGDAGIISAYFPVSRGTSKTAAKKQLVEELKKSIKDSNTIFRPNKFTNSDDPKARNYPRVSHLLRDLERNGYNSRLVLTEALTEVRSELYREFFKELPRDVNSKYNSRKLNRIARDILRIDRRIDPLVNYIKKQADKYEQQRGRDSRLRQRWADISEAVITDPDTIRTFEALPSGAELRQAADGGVALKPLIANDKVPKTIFGIPVASTPESYTEQDITFFTEHPDAAGYYEL